MRNISEADVSADAERFLGLCRELGRRKPLRDPVHNLVEELKFSPAQIHALLWIGTDGGLTMGDIARRQGITDKSVTGIVDRLEKDGFVSRTRSDEDRRVIQVQLTKKGHGIFQKLSALMRARVEGLFVLLDAEERQTLIRIFQKIVERLQKP